MGLLLPSSPPPPRETAGCRSAAGPRQMSSGGWDDDGALNGRKSPLSATRRGVLAIVAAAVAMLPVGGDDTNWNVVGSVGLIGGSVANAAVTTAKQQETDIPPPPITTHSSERALLLSSDLERLGAKMYGAYWCSHCHEQKQIMGAEAMARIPYVECAKNGLNNQQGLCKQKDIPGYPTWEVGGKLFPGEMELVELEDIVGQVTNRKSI